MVVRFYAGELLTGRVWGELPVASGAWNMQFRDAGSVEVTLPWRGEVLAAFPGMRETLTPWRCFLAAVTDDGTVLEAGPIRAHSYDDAGGTLKVNATGMRGIFARRFLVQPYSETPPQRQSFTYTGTLGNIARAVVNTAMSQPQGGLPIDLPPVTDGTHTRTYHGYEFNRISELLKKLEDVENGPDIEFRPYRTNLDGVVTHIRWEMRTGQPELSQYTRPAPGPVSDHVWDHSVVHSGVLALDVDVDPDNMGDIAYVTGSGSEREMLTSVAKGRRLLDRGFPLLEVDESRSTVTRQSTLDAHARALRDISAAPWQTWKLTVRASGPGPRLGDYLVGDWVRVYVGDHPYLTPKASGYRTRIMGISGDISEAVKVTLAPTLEDR